MFCKQCGKEIQDGTKYCSSCGAKVDESETSDVKSQPEVIQPIYYAPPRKKKRRWPIVLVVLCVIFVIVLAVSMNQDGANSTDFSNDVDMILDVESMAGLGFDGLQERVPNLKDGGEITLTSESGEEIQGQVYYLDDTETHFTLVDDKVVSFQYWSSEKIPYNKENDIFLMFGITPSNKMTKEADTGVALRYSSVNDTVSDFWIQVMDKEDKTFEVVKITFDSRFGGKLANEPDKPDLEVLEYDSTSDGYTRYITGKIKNNSGKTYNYAQVSINLYKDETLLGSTLANVNNLGPGEIWEFQAIVLYDECNKFKIVDVAGF